MRYCPQCGFELMPDKENLEGNITTMLSMYPDEIIEQLRQIRVCLSALYPSTDVARKFSLFLARARQYENYKISGATREYLEKKLYKEKNENYLLAMISSFSEERAKKLASQDRIPKVIRHETDSSKLD